MDEMSRIFLEGNIDYLKKLLSKDKFPPAKKKLAFNIVEQFEEHYKRLEKDYERLGRKKHCTCQPPGKEFGSVEDWHNNREVEVLTDNLLEQADSVSPAVKVDYSSRQITICSLELALYVQNYGGFTLTDLETARIIGGRVSEFNEILSEVLTQERSKVKKVDDILLSCLEGILD